MENKIKEEVLNEIGVNKKNVFYEDYDEAIDLTLEKVKDKILKFRKLLKDNLKMGNKECDTQDLINEFDRMLKELK
jgi:hypothetical protein